MIAGHYDPAASEHQFTGHSVPMVTHTQNFDPKQIDHFDLDGTSDGVMVTGQLSGCCFCWLAVGGNLLCAHIKPSATLNGVRLQNLIAVSGRFNGHPHSTLGTFGSSDHHHPPNHAIVIGVRVGGAWRLYCQLSTDLFRTITHAYRLHPGSTSLL